MKYIEVYRGDTGGRRVHEYMLNPDGEWFIQHPDRNCQNQTTTGYFKTLILIYVLAVQGRYEPTEFKEWVSSLGVLTSNDDELMHTRHYTAWKHHVDGAKRDLLNLGLLEETKAGRFTIPGAAWPEVLGCV